MRRRKRVKVIVSHELDAVLKQQDGSESDQSDRSNVTSSRGRRESGKNAGSKKPNKDDQPVMEVRNYDIEETDSKELFTGLERAAFPSRLPFDKMSSQEVEYFSDFQGPSRLALIEIRNRILQMWFENPKKQLTDYDVRKMEAPYNSDPALVLRTHTFLERHGFINCGMSDGITSIPNPPSADTQKIKLEPEETPHYVDESPLDPDGAYSLYEDHQIKEEMVIGPTVFQMQSFEYSCVGPSVAVSKKNKLSNKQETEKHTAEKNLPTTEDVDEAAQRNTPNISKCPVSESKLPDVTASVDSQQKVSKGAVSTKSKVKTSKYVNNGSDSVTVRVGNEKHFSKGVSGTVTCDRVLEYSCDICEYSTNFLRGFNSHVKAHAAAEKYYCDMCPYITTRTRTLISHLKTHSNDRPFVCKICDAKFKQLRILKQHLIIHTGKKPYSCDVCSKSFKRKYHLETHRKIHAGDKPFSCDVCNKSFSHKGPLVRHRRIHTGEKPFSCNVCKKCFSRKSYLHSHRLLHTGEKPFSCDVCNKSFSHKGPLVRHRRIHTGEKQFSCDVCYKDFSQKSILDQHRRIHTGEKQFSCDVCYKDFSQKSNLDQHRRIHTGEKPFSCDVCFKGFSQKSNLDLHRRIHTGEKPFSCDVCFKGFSQKSNLDKHRRIHSGEKPFSCDV